MWFKNLQLYRLGALAVTRNAFADLLSANRYAPLGTQEQLRHGWAEPVPGSDGLLYDVQGQWLLRLDTESKSVPTGVVNRVAKARAAEMEEQQGFPPGKKAMKELKERITDELLPRAFPRLVSTFVWIDPVAGWLAIDASSSAAADVVIKELLRLDAKLPIESLRVQRSPTGCMTAWLESDEAPHNFTIDQDAELRATGESKAAIRWVKHTLDPEDVGRHIAAGKQCTRLAMTWNSRVSFVLTESLEVRGIRPLDVIKENGPDGFDNDMYLMTSEFRALLDDLVDALGGFAHA